MSNTYFVLLARLVSAVILIPVGYLKLIGNQTDVDLFLALEMEPHGRVIIGLCELIAGLMLLTPQAALGAVLAVGVMFGAIIAHATVLGLDLRHNVMLAFVLISSAFVLAARRKDLPIVGRSFDQGPGSSA